jgi:hypothetical protein
LNKAIDSFFDQKSLTYLIASPDEIANALVDEKIRPLWDPNVQSITKLGDDNLKVIYNPKTNQNPITETLKYNFIVDKEGNYIIRETVNNGEFYRFYELQPV